MLKFNNKEISDDINDVFLVSLLLTWNISHTTFFYCFYCWLCTGKCLLGNGFTLMSHRTFHKQDKHSHEYMLSPLSRQPVDLPFLVHLAKIHFEILSTTPFHWIVTIHENISFH